MSLGGTLLIHSLFYKYGDCTIKHKSLERNENVAKPTHWTGHPFFS